MTTTTVPSELAGLPSRAGNYEPWWHAADLGVTVTTRDMPELMRGAWDPATRTVYVDRRLSERELRCTLAHELVHVERGDDGRQPAHVERFVSSVAAARLIPANQLEDTLVAGADLPHDNLVRMVCSTFNVDEPTALLRLDRMAEA